MWGRLRNWVGASHSVIPGSITVTTGKNFALRGRRLNLSGASALGKDFKKSGSYILNFLPPALICPLVDTADMEIAVMMVTRLQRAITRMP